MKYLVIFKSYLFAYAPEVIDTIEAAFKPLYLFGCVYWC